ncbi:hypothetical protein HOLleu_02481 [Holothuria leucospilota]|uniref:Uncharacterized protein n=1 Tax=Holothuria leucospilota TaxID=206669 RepID=A0A9Q1CRC8_HOLLE|nr:hypothetical protein HOLleu_02481 [Holothuria leucospilota]
MLAVCLLLPSKGKEAKEKQKNKEKTRTEEKTKTEIKSSVATGCSKEGEDRPTDVFILIYSHCLLSFSTKFPVSNFRFSLLKSSFIYFVILTIKLNVML